LKWKSKARDNLKLKERITEKVNYYVSGGLNEDQLQKIHQSALTVIEEVGIEVPHQEVLRLVSNQPGVSIKGQRVYFEPDLVERCLKEIQESQSATKEEEFQLSTTGYASKILDLDTGEIREPHSQDLIEMTKLADALGMRGCAPIFPKDLPEELAEITTYKLCWQNSRDIGGAGIFSSVKVFEYIYEMAQAIGRPFGFGMHMISPLKCDPFLLEIAVHFLDRKINMRVGNMPMIGATSPIFLTGSLVQSVAEVLAGATLLKLISRDGKVSFGPFVHSFDMKYSNIVYGSPEYVLINLAIRQIAQFYGTSSMAKTFNIMAKEPDAQAALESAAGTAVLALAGARNFGWAGLLSVDEIFSGELLVIQNEIMEYVKRVVKGFEFSPLTIGIDIIKECAEDNSYFTHPTTLGGFRDLLWDSSLFEYNTLKQWQDKGSKTIRQKAREIAKEKIAQHRFRLDEDKQKELDKIYKRAEEEFR